MTIHPVVLNAAQDDIRTAGKEVFSLPAVLFPLPLQSFSDGEVERPADTPLLRPLEHYSSRGYIHGPGTDRDAEDP